MNDFETRKLQIILWVNTNIIEKRATYFEARKIKVLFFQAKGEKKPSQL